MASDDVVYISLLIFTIIFGSVIRKITDLETKKWTSTLVGFLIVLFASGVHILHPLLCLAVNAFIILFTSKKTCHVISFGFTFLYLLFFRTTEYFNIPYPPAHTNLIQMMFTLKLVGLAFEVHDSFVLQKHEAALDPPITSNRNYVKPSFVDIFHFSFCYIGVLTGPYYTYKTYSDYFTTGFSKVAPCGFATLTKLKNIPFLAAVYLLTTHYFPLKYMESEEFYTETSFWYRLFYMWPVFTTFRMRIYIGLLLSECACTMAGLGAYPTETKPRPGMGPSTNLELVQKIVSDTSLAETQEYNFEAVHNIDVAHGEFDPSFRSTIKYWNMCIQYWLAYVVYKRFPNKALRTAVVFAVSAYWHGVYLGYYCCLLAPPFYLPIEDIWDKLLRRDTTGIKRKVLDAVFWVTRMQAFTYMGIAFSLLTTEKVIRYYRSIHFIFHITAALALVLGLALTQVIRPKRAAATTEKKQG